MWFFQRPRADLRVDVKKWKIDSVRRFNTPSEIRDTNFESDTHTSETCFILGDSFRTVLIIGKSRIIY